MTQTQSRLASGAGPDQAGSVSKMTTPGTLQSAQHMLLFEPTALSN